MGELKALLFDVDGTLADSERDGHRVAFNMAFAKAGIDWKWTVDIYGQLLSVTGGRERIHHYLDNHPMGQMGPMGQTEFNKTIDVDDLVSCLHVSKTGFYTQLLAAGKIPLRLGVKRLLKEALAKGLRLAIATTAMPMSVSKLLSHTLGSEAANWFEVIAAGDVVTRKKPAPDIYQYVMRQMKLTPADCMVFEDSENGLKSARAAALPTIVASNEYTRKQDFSGAVLVLDHWGEPDRPFKVLHGEAHGTSYLTVELIKMLHFSIVPTNKP